MRFPLACPWCVCVTADLRDLLPIYVQATFGSKVRLIRSDFTLGPTGARFRGIRASVTKVIVVMDADVEVQPGW